MILPQMIYTLYIIFVNLNMPLWIFRIMKLFVIFYYTNGKNMEYLQNVFSTHVFDIFGGGGDGLVPTTNTFCEFNATLTCAVIDEKCHL